jgi:uncharacterized repeat protein (TIGR01451 family)
VNQGSGRGDLRYLVPTAGHPFTASTYFALVSKWGSNDAAPGGDTYASEDGFEEWKVRKAPNVGIVKTANPVGPVNAGSSIGFDINVSNTGAAAATNVTISDNLPAGAGNDLNWSLNPAFSGCSITGALGSQAYDRGRLRDREQHGNGGRGWLKHGFGHGAMRRPSGSSRTAPRAVPSRSRERSSPLTARTRTRLRTSASRTTRPLQHPTRRGHR